MTYKERIQSANSIYNLYKEASVIKSIGDVAKKVSPVAKGMAKGKEVAGKAIDKVSKGFNSIKSKVKEIPTEQKLGAGAVAGVATTGATSAVVGSNYGEGKADKKWKTRELVTSMKHNKSMQDIADKSKANESALIDKNKRMKARGVWDRLTNKDV